MLISWIWSRFVSAIVLQSAKYSSKIRYTIEPGRRILIKLSVPYSRNFFRVMNYSGKIFMDHQVDASRSVEFPVEIYKGIWPQIVLQSARYSSQVRYTLELGRQILIKLFVPYSRNFFQNLKSSFWYRMIP